MPFIPRFRKPKPEKKAEKAKPVKWVLYGLPGGKSTVAAFTKSEARAYFKQLCGFKDRLPVGVVVMRAGR